MSTVTVENILRQINQLSPVEQRRLARYPIARRTIAHRHLKVMTQLTFDEEYNYKDDE